MGAASLGHYCPRCRARVRVEGPPAGAKIACVAGVVAVVGATCAIPLLGIGLLMTAPVVAFAGLGLGPLWAAAVEPPCCPRCGCEVERAGAERQVTHEAVVAVER